MIAALGAWLAKSALMGSPIGGLLRRVPARVWKLLLLAIVVGLIVWRGLAWHDGRVDALRKEAFAAGRASMSKDMAALRDELEKRNRESVAQMRSENDAKLRDVGRAADALRMRGAGRATCSTVFPSSSGGDVEAGGSGSDPVSGLLDPRGTELLALPFPAATDLAESHDALRVEVEGWRAWHAHFVKLWAEYAEKAAAAQEKAR